MKLAVLTIPNDLLKQKSELITLEQLKEKSVQQFFDNMVDTMFEDNGIGIASPQVGKHWRAIVVTRDCKPEIFINPEITKRSFRKIKGEERCLSVPGLKGIVERYKSITIKALDRQGNKVMLDAHDFDAVVFQHEIDHLDGILFLDRAKKIEPVEND